MRNLPFHSQCSWEIFTHSSSQTLSKAVARCWIRCTWVNQWDYRATNVEINDTDSSKPDAGSFNLPHFSDCSSHREHIQGFFYTKESQSFVKPSSFKSRALKFPTKSIINAALSTLSCSRPPISSPLHTHMLTHSRIPWFDLTKGLRSKRLLFNTFAVLKLT